MSKEINTKASDYILDTSKEYSLYVCSTRAIPFVTDGLKDGQRKALWLMKSRADKLKVISLAGEMISSNLYIHGDQSAAKSISLLAAPYVNNVTMFKGIGTFGTRVAPTEGIASPRYVYVKRSAAAQDFLYNDLDIVPLQENYDGSTLEPKHFLPLIPNILLNGVSGIAIGWSTEILPRRFDDLVDATLAAIDGKEVKQLKPTYSYLTVDVKHLGENAWEISGRADIVDASTVRVRELPPDLTLEKFKARLNKMEDDGEIRGYVDRSTDQIDVEIKMARGAVKKWTFEDALDAFKLRQKKSERIVVVDWDCASIKQYEKAEDVVKDFVEWRLGFYSVRYAKKLEDAEYELKFWKGVKLCFDKDLPLALGKIKNRAEIKKQVSGITNALKLDDKTIERIVGLPTYRWAQDFYTEVAEKIKALEASIAEYNDILGDEKKRRNIFKQEVKALKGKY